MHKIKKKAVEKKERDIKRTPKVNTKDFIFGSFGAFEIRCQRVTMTPSDMFRRHTKYSVQ